MRKFFSVWLILLVIVAFAAALLVSYPLLTARAEQAASDDLNVLLDAAFMRISLAEETAKTVADSEDENILGKARAIDRFLSHDDALLQTDALVVLAEMLHISAIDVTDMDGNIVASSVSTRIGRSLTEDTKTAWTQEVLEGENVSRTLVDKDNAALLSGCVSRTDTEGLIYIQSLDVAIMEAMTASTPEQVLLDMSFIKDAITVVDEEDVPAPEDTYTVIRTKGDVTLSAARPISQVYSARSAVLLAESIGFLLCMLFAAVIQSMLIKKRLDSRRDAKSISALDDAESTQTYDTPDEDATEKEAPAETEPVSGTAVPRRTRRKEKAKKPRRKIFEFVEIEEAVAPPDDETNDAGKITSCEAAIPSNIENSTQDPADNTPESTIAEAVLEEALSEPLPTDSHLAEEAAVEFSAPEAVIEEALSESTVEAEQPKRPGRRRRTQQRAESSIQDAAAEPVIKPRSKRKKTAPIDADEAFDKIFD